MSMPSSETRSRVSSSRTASGSAPQICSRAPRAAMDLGPGAQEHLQPLPGLLPAGEGDRVLAPRGIDGVGDEDAVRDDLVVAGKPARRRVARPLGDGDPLVDPAREEAPRRASPSFIQPRSPEAWWVATIGAVAIASTEMQVTGVIGSCRWSTSKRSRSSTRLIRKIARGLRMMFGSEPFAGTITERPIGITFAGGSPWRPTRGCRARVNCPGGSLPITSRTSCPRASSASAWSSACSTTAPQNDHENGTTMPIFTRGSLFTPRSRRGGRVPRSRRACASSASSKRSRNLLRTPARWVGRACSSRARPAAVSSALSPRRSSSQRVRSTEPGAARDGRRAASARSG